MWQIDHQKAPFSTLVCIHSLCNVTVFLALEEVVLVPCFGRENVLEMMFSRDLQRSFVLLFSPITGPCSPGWPAGYWCPCCPACQLAGHQAWEGGRPRPASPNHLGHFTADARMALAAVTQSGPAQQHCPVDLYAHDQ